MMWKRLGWWRWRERKLEGGKRSGIWFGIAVPWRFPAELAAPGVYDEFPVEDNYVSL